MFKAIDKIQSIAEELNFLYNFSDLMTKSEILEDLTKAEETISSALEELRKYKKELTDEI